VASSARLTQGKVRGVSGTTDFSGLEGATLPAVYHVTWKQGSDATLRLLGATGAVVKKSWADQHHIRVGGSLSVRTPTGQVATYRVRGSYKDDARLFGDVAVSSESAARAFGADKVAIALIKVRPGAEPKAVQGRINTLMKAKFPDVKTQSRAQFVSDRAAHVDKLVTLIYALLSLAVIVSLFGIVNTLVLSIHERTRELGMLRAIGTSRRQVRQIIRYEAVITALIGAVLGVVLGVLFALIISRPLASQGFVISIPIGSLLALLVLAALAGVLAAITPARRAARLDVLEALAYE